MFKSTEAFINNRAPFTTGFQLKVIPTIKAIKGGNPNQCYFNAQKLKESSERKGKKMSITSGWIVNSHDTSNNCTAIIAHWWNIDENNNHIDTSPILGSNKREYVQDNEILNFCAKNDDKLAIHQHFSLLYINGKYEVLIDQEKFHFRKIDSLKTEFFYNLI